LLGAGLQGYSFATALPSAADARAALSNAPAIRNDFDVGGKSLVFGLASLGAAYPLGGDSSKTFVMGFTETVDLSTIGKKQDLLLGFTGLGLAGSFSDLQVSVTKNGATAASFDFHDAGSAAGLADRTIDLGSLAGYEGLMTLGFAFDFTTMSADASFSADLLFGNSTIGSGIHTSVPEPRSLTLLSLGIAALLLSARLRKRPAVRGLSVLRRLSGSRLIGAWTALWARKQPEAPNSPCVRFRLT
jgi:hypothetical protein